ncbi:MAG: hypothetical protein AAB606_04565 [Patescibacteria group bacterium]
MKSTTEQPEEFQLGDDSLALDGQWINPDPDMPKEPTEEQLRAAGFVGRNIRGGGAGNIEQVAHIRYCAKELALHAFEATTAPDFVLIFTRPSNGGGILDSTVPNSSAS